MKKQIIKTYNAEGVYSMEVKKELVFEEIHKEIDLVQSCINRMAQNSFMIKGWAFAILAALVALTSDTISKTALCVVAITIIICLWILDAFFLKTEKMYRKKYDWILAERPKGNREYLYNLNPTVPKEAVQNTMSWIRTMFTKTLTPFYIPPIILFVLWIIVLHIDCNTINALISWLSV